MTTLTLRRMKADFIVSGPDIEPARFESRRKQRTGARPSTPAHPSRRSARN